ncbi:EAL domain-containing protein [Shewanella sp. SM73]|uniref:EAL domain-containing protein n=1 Tax=Shewanella TaxID=22 RepID=UPI0021DB0B6B|nr:EAL domain-containing protein [Shewanella sp. SM73]MCU8032431.1 EAL domain-containing protein [Shewanella sp. SM73]
MNTTQAQIALYDQPWHILIYGMGMSEITELTLFNQSAKPSAKMPLLLTGKNQPSTVAINKKYDCKNVNNDIVNDDTSISYKKAECLCGQPVNINTLMNKAQWDSLLAVNSTEVLIDTVAYYQPQHHVTSGKLYGAEALARWNHPKLGVLGPEYLLPRMHSTIMRNALWKQMLDYTINMLKHLQGLDLCLSVNISADIASSARWAENTIHRVAQSGSNSSHIGIEITEDYARFEVDLAAAISKLRLHGFKCAIDDFGTGFSSLQRLAMTPFNLLKIDRSFVHQARESLVSHKILANTILLAHDLGLSVIAEGVETEADLERITNLGADIAQGYYFAKPISADNFIQYVRN